MEKSENVLGPAGSKTGSYRSRYSILYKQFSITTSHDFILEQKQIFEGFASDCIKKSAEVLGSAGSKNESGNSKSLVRSIQFSTTISYDFIENWSIIERSKLHGKNKWRNVRPNWF